MDAYQQQFSQDAIGTRPNDSEVRGLADSFLYSGELRCPPA